MADLHTFLHHWQDEADAAYLYRLLATLEPDAQRRSVFERLMEQHTGPAAIGHVRYATCGADDRGYAQPLERPHIRKRKWFSFGFNGQLANYPELRAEILADLAATGWRHAFDATRGDVARESRAVRDFSDECRFWAAHRGT